MVVSFKQEILRTFSFPINVRFGYRTRGINLNLLEENIEETFGCYMTPNKLETAYSTRRQLNTKYNLGYKIKNILKGKACSMQESMKIVTKFLYILALSCSNKKK